MRCALCGEEYADKSALSRHRLSTNPVRACLGNRLLRSCGMAIDRSQRPGHKYANLLGDLKDLWGDEAMDVGGLRQMLKFHQSPRNIKSLDGLLRYVTETADYGHVTDLQLGDHQLRGSIRLARVATTILYPWFRIKARPYMEFSRWCIFSDKRKSIQFSDHLGRTIPLTKIKRYLYTIILKNKNEFGVFAADMDIAIADFHADLVRLETLVPLHSAWRAYGQFAREIGLRI